MRSTAQRSALRARLTKYQADTALGVVLCALAAAGAVWLLRQLMPDILRISTFDFWFETDGPAVFAQMTDRFTFDHERLSRHPLFALLTFPPVYVARHVAGLSAASAVTLVVSLVCALWAAVMFAALRLLGLDRLAATAFTLLGLCSASSLFLFPLPETFGLGAVTVATTTLAALAMDRSIPQPTTVAHGAAAISLSVTASNGIAGLVLCIGSLGWIRGAAILSLALGAVAGLQVLQAALFPHAGYFFLPGGQEAAYLFHPLGLGMAERLRVFAVHSLLMPEIEVGYGDYLSVQGASTSLGSTPVLMARAIWLSLLLLGATSLRRSRYRIASLVIITALFSQAGLMLAFGQETFIYTSQSVSILLFLAAASMMTPFRRLAFVGVVLLIGFTAWQNGGQFGRASRLLHLRAASQRDFTAAVRALTAPSELVILGLPPLVAQGLKSQRWRTLPEPFPLRHLTVADSLPADRKGWYLYFENWTPELVQQLRGMGAAFFATSYKYGHENHAALRRYLADSATLVASAQSWAIYRLGAQ